MVALIIDGVLQNGLERHQSNVAKKAQLASCPAGNPQVHLLFSQGLATRLTSIYIVGNKGTKVHFYIREKMARWEKGDKQSPYSKNMLCTIAHFAKLCSSFTKSMPAYVHDKGKNFPLIFYMHFLRRNC